MGGGRGDSKTVFPSQPDNRAAQFGYVAARFLNVFADAGADFDHRLVHLGLNVLLEESFALFDNFKLDVGPKVVGFRVDSLVLFFDAERETGRHGRLRSHDSRARVQAGRSVTPVSYTHLRAHETGRNLACRLLL